ncbi:MAG: DUF1854 domain-containing protein [Gammaproteobacteria bacterium]
MTAVNITETQDGRLMVKSGTGEATPVRAQPCFPWSEPGRFVSLRDGDGEEVALIEDLTTFDAAPRAAVERSLAETSFVLEVENVKAIDTEFEIRNWKVHTRQGPYVFQTRLDEWPRRTPHDGLILKDVAGNLFHMKDPRHMDKTSRKLLWPFID